MEQLIIPRDNLIILYNELKNILSENIPFNIKYVLYSNLMNIHNILLEDKEEYTISIKFLKKDELCFTSSNFYESITKYLIYE